MDLASSGRAVARLDVVLAGRNDGPLWVAGVIAASALFLAVRCLG
jgi:hypothetical protein